MPMALTTNNKVGFVNGNITYPNFDHLVYSVWTHCISMVISWILNSISKEIANSLLYMDDASNV